MFERVLVGTLYTEPRVLGLSQVISNLPVKEVLLVHIVESVISREAHDRRRVRVAREELEKWAREVEAATSVTVTPIVELGVPARKLVQIASDRAVDTVVMSAFVGTPWDQFFLGSTPLDVIRHGSTNMLILHPDPTEAGVSNLAMPLLEHVLFATDFSDFAAGAYEKLQSSADEGLEKVTLMHVQDVTRIDPHLIDRLPEFDEKDHKRLEEMSQVLKDRGVSVDIRIELGVPEKKIGEVAEEMDVSCIAVGSRGGTPDGRLQWGSVSERVVREAHQPVLVIKLPELIEQTQ